jgi:hypothetical protein
MGKYLYTWHWVGGGGNQAWADSEEQAIEKAEAVWSSGVVTNLRRVGERGDKAVDRYFDSISRD